MDQEIKLTYNGPLNQVRVSFKPDVVKAEKKISKDLLKRAKAKLEDELSKGNIEAYSIYEETFQAFWDFLRARSVSSDRPVIFVLAQGYRRVPGLQVRFDAGKKRLLLTLPAKPELLVKHGWQRVAAQIYAQANIQPHVDPLLRSCIWEAMGRALKGLEVKDFPLVSPVVVSEGTGTRLIFDKDNQRALLFLYDGHVLQGQTDLQELVKRIFVHVPKLTEKLSHPRVFKRELYEVLKDLQAYPESLGFGLPLCLPIAFGSTVAANAPANATQNTKAQAPAGRVAPSAASKPAAASLASKPTAGKAAGAPAKGASARSYEQVIRIKIIDRGLEARINWCDDDKLANDHYESDRSWLEKALADHKITYGYENYLDKLLSKITLGQSLRGQMLAMGVPPEPGEHPYLHPCFLDKKISENVDKVDLRSAQNRQVVEVGDLICEPRYLDGKPGMSIFGTPLHAEVPSDIFEIDVGNGIDAREDGRCFALIRGVPHIEGNHVSCRQIYLHEGDVNLQSGDIFFDGSVEIRGNIDTGARVFAKGDLIVRGSIGQAKVRCGGDLKVEKGIVTSQDGMVYVGGGAFAQFVENSRLVVHNRLEVAKSIINSDIKVGTEIVLLARNGKGVIGGGTICAQEGLVSFDLGFQDGEKTVLHIGSDWKLEYRIGLLERRDQRIKRYVQQRQYEYDDLKKRPGADPNRLNKIEGRLFRGKRLNERIQKLIETAKNKIKWSEEAIICVQGTLDPNVEITIGGKNIAVHKAMKDVMVTAVRFRDQFVNPLPYLDQFRKMIVDRAS